MNVGVIIIIIAIVVLVGFLYWLIKNSRELIIDEK